MPVLEPITKQNTSAGRATGGKQSASRLAGTGRALLRNLLWLPVSLLAAVALLEGIFAWAHIGEEEFLKIDPLLGYSHLENKPITFRSEGYSQGKINSAGNRDRERTVAKPPGVIRIACLGDSKTESLQVPIEQTFPQLLEHKLSKHGRYEVLNFGMSAFGTGQEYVQYLSQVRQYRPDIVVVVYHALDTDENVYPEGDPNPVPRPYFTFDGDNHLFLDWRALCKFVDSDRARLYGAIDGIRRHSRIYGMLSKLEPVANGDKTFRAWSKLSEKVIGGPWHQLMQTLPPPVKLTVPGLGELDRQAVTTKHPPVGKPLAITATAPEAQAVQLLFVAHQGRMQVTAALIRQLQLACARDGCKLVVAALPAPSNSVWYFREMNMIENQARREHFSYVNVHKVFPSFDAMQKSPYLYEKFHFTPPGHELVAKTLYEALRHDKLVN